MNAALVLIGSGCLVCLLPLALYLLFLASLNNRRQPTLLSGTWDLTCLLLGLSGFFLVGGPALLSALDSAWRVHILEGNFAQIRSHLRSDAVVWSILAALYLLALVGGTLLLMRARRHVSVIYNFAGAPDELVARALERLGLRWRRQYGAFEVLPARPEPTLREVAEKTVGEPGPVRPVDQEESEAFFDATQIEVTTFPAMRHVTLRWTDADPAIRRALEAELVKLLERTTTPVNPAGGWLLTAAVALFFVMLVWTVFLVIWTIRNPVLTRN